MGDFADEAQKTIELEQAGHLAKSKRPTGPQADGFCHYCNGNVESLMRWCDTECRDAYDEEQRLMRLR
jgi:hypothetical protein